MHVREIQISTQGRQSTRDITDVLQDAISIQNGILLVYVPHTTCALVINEGYDPNVMKDMISHLSKLIPQDPSFSHTEGNSDAHIKAMLLGNSVQLIVEGEKILLGTWERIFLCDFDGPRTRRILIQEVG